MWLPQFHNSDDKESQARGGRKRTQDPGTSLMTRPRLWHLEPDRAPWRREGIPWWPGSPGLYPPGADDAHNPADQEPHAEKQERVVRSKKHKSQATWQTQAAWAESGR